MKNAALFAAAGMLAAGAYLLYRKRQDGGEDGGGIITETVSMAANEVSYTLSNAAQSAAQVLDTVTGGAMKISSMASVDPAALNHPNMRAFLKVIRAGEGTSDEAGYRRMFGGELFQSFADHPRKTITKNGYVSTAAGAYQFLSSTWDETRRLMRLPDFSPRSQDIGALGRIAARGALEDVIAGRFDLAIKKVNREWASMPGSPYGQPVMTIRRAAHIYAAAGGSSANLG